MRRVEPDERITPPALAKGSAGILPAETEGGTTECVLQALRAPTEAITGASRRASEGHTPLPMQALAALARGRAAFSGLEPDACFRQLISFPASKRRYYKIGVIISRRV